jgi:Luciferase-like monooxygenase
MKFGIFYEHQLPRPWTERSEYELLQNSLAQIELADQLGYDHAWEVEHHFLEEYSHSSAPEVFLGAATQRTRRIRLGHLDDLDTAGYQVYSHQNEDIVCLTPEELKRKMAEKEAARR